MSIDLSKATALSDQYGNIVQLELGGRVIWAAQTGNEPAVILDVAKQTATTYAGETAYTNEEFILLDIYPKKGGAVKVTYGGLTKTIKDTSGAEEPNAIQVFFGTFNGVSDSVTTPASGRLTIEGAYRGYGSGTYSMAANKEPSTYAPCVTSVVDFGNPVYIGNATFKGCTNFVPTSLPSGLTSIGNSTFHGCTSFNLTSLPSGITSIGNYAFYGCSALTSIIPDSVQSIGDYAFYGCSALTSINLAEGLVSIGNAAFMLCENSAISDIPMSNGSVVIPSTVQRIGGRAFATNHTEGTVMYCDSYLGTVRFMSTTPPTLGDSEGAFNSIEYVFGNGKTFDKHQLIVPKGSSEVYKNTMKTSEWSVVEAS